MVMSAQRDELHQLIEQLPDQRVPLALADVRRLLEPSLDVAWPPPWFGAASGSRRDIGRRHDDLLAEGFGR